MADPLTLGLVITTAASVASALLSPKQQIPDTTGPRLGDTGVSSSAYGETIPINYGTVRTGCNIIWATDLVEVKIVTESEVGKGGSQTVTNTRFEYFLNAQMAVGEGVVTRFLRIWADNKLIYDARPGSEVFFKYPGAKIRFQYGTENQLPDPFIESVEGAGLTPANRGLANFVVENMPVADFGNRVPQFNVEATWAAGEEFPTRTLWSDAESAHDAGDGDIQGSNPAWDKGDDVAVSAREGLIWAAKVGQLDEIVTWSKIDLFKGRIVSQRYFDGADNPKDDLTDNVTTGLGSAGALQSRDRLLWTGFPSQTTDNRYWNCDRTTFRVFARSSDVENGRQWHDIIDFATVDDSGDLQRGSAMACTVNLVGSPPELVFVSDRFVNGAVFTFVDVTTAISGSLVNVWNLAGPDFNGDCWGIWDQAPGTGLGTAGIIRIPIYTAASVEEGGFDGKGIGLLRSAGPLVDANLVFDLTNAILGKDAGSLNARGIWLDEDNQHLILLFAGSLGDEGKIVRWDIATESIVDSAKLSDLGLSESAVGPEARQSVRWARGQAGVDAFFVMGAGLSLDIAEIFIDDPVNGVVSEGSQSNFSATIWDTGPSGFDLEQGSDEAIIAFYRDRSAVVKTDDSNPVDVNQVYFSRTGKNQADLADIVTDLSQRVGLESSDLDVTDLVGTPVRGFEVIKRGTARNAIDRLSIAFFFDPVESDNVLKYVNRGKVAVATIDFDDLGAALERLPDEPNRVDETSKQESEIPKQIDLQYIDQERDYQAGDVYAKRMRSPDPTVFGEELQKIELPIVFTPTEAERIADSQLAVAWTEADGQKFFLPYRFLEVDPADNVTIIRPNTLDLLSRIDEISFGSGMITEYNAVEEDLEIYSSLLNAEGGLNFLDQEILFSGEALLFPVDSPLVRDGHSRGTGTGPYLGVTNESGTFRGAVLHQSLDQLSWQQVDVFDDSVLGGLVLDAAPALDPSEVFQTDTDTEITLVPFNEETEAVLATITDAQLLQDNNAAWWGNPDDGYEIVKYRDVTDNGDGTFTIGGAWIRGRRGTNRVAEAGHSAGDDFLLMNPNGQVGMWSRKVYEASEIDSTRFFRATPVGNIFDSATFESVTITGTDLKPYEVVHVEDSRPNSPTNEDIRLEWVRQTRIGGTINWNDGVEETALGEEFERYEVVLLAGPGDPDPGSEALSKTFNDQVDTSGDDFTEAELTAAGYALSDDVDFVIYQISAVVGRGFPRTHTVPGV